MTNAEINKILQEVFVIAGGFPADTLLAPQLAQTVAADGNWGSVVTLLNNYLGAQAHAIGGAALVTKLTQQGVGLDLTAEQAAATAAAIASGHMSWADLVAGFILDSTGAAAATLENRAAAAQAFTDALVAEGKGDFYSGFVYGAAHNLLQGVTDNVSSVAEVTQSLEALVQRLGALGLGGKSLDGYLAGATVFVDANGNGEHDAGEFSTTTDAAGNFVIPAGAGVGDLVAVGGIDLLTGTAFAGVMTAPAGATVITPFTTLMQALVSGGEADSVQEANQMIIDALGLPAGIDLLNYDAMALLAAGPNPEALAVEKIAIEVMNLITLSSVALAAATPLDTGAAAVFVLDAFAHALAGGGPIDLTDASTLAGIVAGAVADYIGATPPGPVLAVIDQIAEVIAASNQATHDADTIADVARAAGVAGGEIPEALDAVFTHGASLTDLLHDFTGDALQDAIDAAPVGNLAPGVPVPVTEPPPPEEPNVAPTLSLVSTLTGGIEDTPVEITYATLAAAADEADANGDAISFRIEAVSSGALAKWNGSSWVAVVAGTTVVGAGEKLQWTPAANVNGSALDAFTVKATDGLLLSGSAVQVKVDVAAVADAPVNTVPGAQAVNEDTQLAFTGGALISVNDVDGNLVSTEVSVLHGNLNVSLAGGASIGAGANSTGDFTITGTQAQVNAALATLTYQGNANYNGPDTLSVLSTDATAGTPLTDTDTVAITVNAVNDAPTLTTVTTLTGATEDIPVEITYATLAAAANEADVDGDAVSFRIEAVSSGSLAKWNGSSWVAVVAGTTVLGAGEKLQWTPAANVNGSALNAFTVKATDGSLLSSSAVQVKMDVAAANDAPTLTTISTLTGATEDLPIEITYATLAAAANEADVDGDAVSFRIEAVSSGALAKWNGSSWVAVVAGTTVLGAGEKLQWTPAANANGSALNAFTVKATDGSLLSSSAVQVKMDVAAVADAPVNTVPGAQAVNEDTQLAFTGGALISVNDADGNLASTEVSVLHGNLNVSLAGGASIGAGANSTGDLTLTGTQAQINAALATLTYQGNANYNGSDTLTVLSTDGTAGTPLTDTDTVAITVNAVNDAPTLTTISTLTGASEDLPIEITYATLAAAANEADVDGDAVSFRIEAVSSGALAKWNGSSWVAVVAGTTVLGAGEKLQWTPAANANGSALNAFTVKATDGTLFSSSAVQVKMDVAAVADAPVNTVPGAQAVNEDTQLAFTGGALISVNDVDGNLASTEVSVLHGNLNVSLAGGASIGAGANSTGDLTLTGTQAQINAALATLTYQGNANYNGSDTLTVLSTDGTAGTPLTDTDTVAITVNAVPDAPVNSVPGAQSVGEDAQLAFTGGALISVSDPEGDLASTAVSVLHGTLNVSLAGGASIGTGSNDTDAFTLTGTQAQINAALATLTYQGNADFSGSDTLTVLSTDATSGTPLTDTDTVAITVNAVNDAPVNTVPGAQGVNEDSALVFSSGNSNVIAVGDVDDADDTVTGNEVVQVQLTATSGTLTLSAATGLSFSFSDANGTGAGDGTADTTMTFRGTLTDVNAALAGMSFVGTSNYNGAASVQIATSDLGHSGSGGVLTDTDSVAITVNAVNDAPVNTVPAAQAMDEDGAALVFSSGNSNAITVGDTDDADNAVSDDEVVQVQLTATHGTMTLSGTTGLTTSFSDANGAGAGDGTADATMTFRGTLADVNAALAGLAFTADSNFTGAASVQIVTNDLGNFGSGGALTASDTVNITVNAVNDAPINTVPAAQGVDEDTALVFSSGTSNAIVVGDVDDADNATTGDEIVQVQLTATHGTLTLSGTTGLTTSFNDANGTGAGTGTADTTMTFRGTLADVNAALAGMSFVADSNYNGAASVQIVTNDLGNFGTGVALTASDTVNITVNAVNDAPANAMPDAQGVNEDTALVFSSGNSNAITVGDTDDADNAVSGDEVVQVQLTATHGALTLSGTTGLSFSFSDANGDGAGDGTSDATMTFRGTIAAVNAALAGLSFTADSDFVGAASVQVVTNDLGNFGSGGAQTDTDSVTVTVNAVNDAPVNTVPGAQGVNEDTALVFSSGNFNAIVVGDVDDADNTITGDEVVQVQLTSTHGTLTLSGTTGLSFSFSDANGTGAGDGTGDTTMTFRGTLADVNAALAGMSFLGASNYNGAASVQIVTNDLGNFGTGGVLTDTDSVAITVNAVNDAPVLDASQSPAFSVSETVGTSFTPAAPTGTAGVLVSTLVTGGSDVDAGTTLGMAITSLDATGSGTLWYSTNGGSSWTQITTVSASSALLLASTARVVFQPNALVTGTISDVFTFKAWDVSSGTSGTTADTSTGSTAFSTATDTVSVTLNAAGLTTSVATPWTYYGGSGVDTITVTGTSITQATIVLGAGNDSLILSGAIAFSTPGNVTLDGGAGSGDVFQLTGASSIDLESGITFSGFESLTGDNSNQTFTINKGNLSSISVIDLAGGTSDKLDLRSGGIFDFSGLTTFAGVDNIVVGDDAGATVKLTLTQLGVVSGATATGISGGTGSAADTLNITSGNVVAASLDKVSKFETISLNGSGAQAITAVNTLVASGATTTITNSSGGALTFVGDAETDGKYVINAGSHGSTINTGRLVDTVNLGSGADTVTFGSSELVSAARDIITAFDKTNDKINIEPTGGAGVAGVSLTGTLLTSLTVATTTLSIGSTTEVLVVNTSTKLAGNLATSSAAGDLDGTNLLLAIGGGSTATVTTTNGAKIFLLVEDSNHNVGIYYGSSGSGNSNLASSEIQLIGVLSGYTSTGAITDFTIANFTNSNLV